MSVSLSSSARSSLSSSLRQAVALALLATLATPLAAQAPRQYPDGSIAGTVSGPDGPEGGVWVIAQTTELNTGYTKIVVTDDAGRFVLPQLPDATYKVWVRGYGLVDSEPQEGRPGDAALVLSAVPAATPQEAAKIYPPDYWLSLLEVPGEETFPGTGPTGNGYSPQMESQRRWLHEFKSDCNFCHQLGNALTRSVAHMDHLGFDSHEEAWNYRTQLGVRGGSMYAAFLQFGREGMMRTMANWTRKVADGAVPPQPPRPQGVERNVVVTLYDIGGDHDFMHDEVSTDKNNPTVNAFGPVYAVSSGHGTLVELDPISVTTRKHVIPTREDPREVSSRFPPPGQPSNFWGMQHLWGTENPADPHNPMMDVLGRVWMTSKIRNEQPAWCRNGSDNKYAQYYPLSGSIRQASVYDPGDGHFELIDTCFHTHHLQFANDAQRTLYFNELIGPIFGWIDTRTWDLTHDEQLSQGWCPQIIDTNGDGKITKPWNPADSANPDPALDSEVRLNLYTVIPDPTNPNVVWGAAEDPMPGWIVRLDRGDNPPESCITEAYKVPEPGFDPRGMDMDTSGVAWVSLAGSSHWASFDRNKCGVLNGPGTDKGEHCDEGWAFFQTDGPKMANTDVPADFHYFGWVDQHNVSGLGANTPILTGSDSDSLIALDPESGEWTRLRVPYPIGFYHRGLDGRVDDPALGWKGRSLWANYGTHLLWHTETGKGSRGKMVQFQIRPDPLAH